MQADGGSPAPATHPNSRSLAAKIADDLREEILKIGPGKFLGGEPDLVERFGVSRPTFRQITQILAQEQLLIIRRGVNGGIYTNAPNLETVRRAASNYLRTRNITPQQLIDASEAVSDITVQQAARCTDEHLRDSLINIRSEHVAMLDRPDDPGFHDLAGRFDDLLAEMADNPAIGLQLAVLHSVAGDGQRNIVPLPGSRNLPFIKLRIQLIDALLANDAEIATVYCQRAVDMVRSWHIPKRRDRKI